jgi:hypothetical protein
LQCQKQLSKVSLFSCDSAKYYWILYFLYTSVGRKMIYGKMPMIIFILASGYLLAVYLLLALAKRTGKKTTATSVSLGMHSKGSKSA